MARRGAAGEGSRPLKQPSAAGSAVVRIIDGPGPLRLAMRRAGGCSCAAELSLKMVRGCGPGSAVDGHMSGVRDANVLVRGLRVF